MATRPKSESTHSKKISLRCCVVAFRHCVAVLSGATVGILIIAAIWMNAFVVAEIEELSGHVQVTISFYLMLVQQARHHEGHCVIFESS